MIERIEVTEMIVTKTEVTAETLVATEEDSYESRPRREQREPLEPPKFDVRYYLGQGLQHKLTEDKLAALIAEKTDLNGDAIKRISIRDCYSFVDFDEKIAESVATQLEDAELDGEKFTLIKATSIAQPREKKKPESEEDTLEADAATEKQVIEPNEEEAETEEEAS